MAFTPTQKFKNLLSKSRRALVVFGRDNDIDEIACALAWKHFLTKQNIKTEIAADNFSAPKNMKFLPGMENIKTAMPSSQKFTVKVDISKIKLGGLNYDIKNDWLNIHINPKEGTITKNDLRAAHADLSFDFIISLNAPDLQSLGKIFLNNAELFYRTQIINIDPSLENEGYGQINFTDATAVSVCESSFKIMDEINEKTIDKNISACLLSGLIGKTKSFKTSNVTPSALQIASRLVDYGADREKIIKNLYRNKNISVFKLLGHILQNLQSDPEKKLVWAKISKEDFLNAGADENGIKEIIDELINQSPDAKAAFLLFEPVKNRSVNAVHCLFRAEPPFDALAMTRQFNSFGNKKTAFFTMEGTTLDEAEKEILRIIKR
ncbi:MAG: hypothetical protein WC430_03865 [Patescibacteria group bacterium]